MRDLSYYLLLLEVELAADRVSRASFRERATVLQRERERLLEELLFAGASSETPIDDYAVRNDLFEFHKRFAIAFASFVFTIFSCRASAMVPRGGTVFGLLTGVAMAALYWLLLVAAQRITLYSVFAFPALMAWTPNSFVIILTLLSFLSRRARWTRRRSPPADTAAPAAGHPSAPPSSFRSTPGSRYAAR